VGWFDKLKSSLSKARDQIRAQLVGPEVDFDTLERTLLAADFGVPMTQTILQAVRKEAKQRPTVARENALAIVRDEIEKVLSARPPRPSTSARPEVILIVGVNGTGKTTTIAKLVQLFKSQGRAVMVGGADTFRAAAVDQLRIWCERLQVPMVSGPANSDPASVAHESISRAQREKIDVLLIDTAGRLHNKINLMRELEKMKRVVQKQISGAPHEVWLVIDATTGSNAFQQTKEFHEALGLTGLIITKLDGTSRGGMVAAIQHQLDIPVLFLGVGEQLDDLQPFEPKAFAEALLK
jgi:fused signal recognition particle receptor